MPSCLPQLALHTIPPDDPAVYDMIGKADTVGVFQIESRAQMTMLPRLRPRCFYDLVIEVAIVRPGPIQGNMVHPYLRRRAGEEPVTYPSEALRRVLEKTLGVPLFQEQAMKVAMVAAGFSADEADKLRRAMAAWRKNSAIDTFHEKIVVGMLRNGYTAEFAEQCFQQIRGFGEYGFPESHAASFAHLVYVSAWLKYHHPAAFAAALLNSQPMGFYAPAQIVRDAQENRVEVRPADVNFSGWDCGLEQKGGGITGDRHEGTKARRHEEGTEIQHSLVPSCQCAPCAGIEDNQSCTPSSSCLRASMPSCLSATPSLRLGLRLIKGLRRAHAHRIEQERLRSGPFLSIRQLHSRTRLPRHVLQRLAEADAFGSLGLSRRKALWEVLELDDEEAPLFEGGGERHGGTKAQRHEERYKVNGSSTVPDKCADDPGTLASTSCLRASVPSCLSSNDAQSEISLPPMPLRQEVMTDYATAGLSLKKHPVALVRDELTKRRIVTAAQMQQMTHGRWVKVAGLVLIRQRPGTASGIVFETLEDETGIVNLIVRPAIYDRYRAAARHAALVQADGYVERQGAVVHVMACRLIDLSDLLSEYGNRSRDFH